MTDSEPSIPRRRTPRLLRVMQVIVMFVTAFLLGAHLVKWAALQVDAVALALLGMLLVVPVADLVRKIKLGEFEAEIGRDEVAKAGAKAAIELSPASEAAPGTPEDRVRALLREDPRLALAKVRIELEEALKRLYSATGGSDVDLRRASLGRLVDGLVRQEVLSPPMASALRDVTALANRAVHGERVDPAAAEQLAVLGIRLAQEVQQLTQERILRPSESRVITQAEVQRFLGARYRVRTVVPLVENPTQNTYLFDQEALESFFEGYEEYAEFVVAVEQVQ